MQSSLVFSEYVFGGNCGGYVCNYLFEVFSDGGVVIKKKVPEGDSHRELSQQVAVEKSLIDTLLQRMNEAHFDEIRKKPFKGINPRMRDGSEYQYTFYASGTEEKINSTVSELDYESPLFQAVRDLEEKIVEQRTI